MQRQGSKAGATQAHGAIVLGDQQRSAALYRLNAAIVEGFGIPNQLIRIEAGKGKLTAGVLFTEVWKALAEQDVEGKLAVYPEAIDEVRGAIARVLERNGKIAGTRNINLGTPLIEVFGKCRIRDWGVLTVELNQPLPDLGIKPHAVQIVGWTCAAAVIGLMVVIARWLDRTHPVEQPSGGLHAVGKVLGWLVFIVIFFPVMWVVIRLMIRWLVKFPDECRVVGQLVAVVGRENPPENPMGDWTAELLWQEIRECVAAAYGKSPGEIGAELELR